MNKKELSKILKPLIKECIKEVIFEEGALSTIISEVVKGTSTKAVFSEKKEPSSFVNKVENQDDRTERKRKQLLEQKKKMLDAIGREAYNGVDLFEGTIPLSNRESSSHKPHGSGPLDGVASNDPGVDISSFSSSGIWKKLAGN